MTSCASLRALRDADLSCFTPSQPACVHACQVLIFNAIDFVTASLVALVSMWVFQRQSRLSVAAIARDLVSPS